MSVVLVIVAHPDDEILGCGGTIARHVRERDSVHVVFLADGVTSRPNTDVNGTVDRHRYCLQALEVIGVEEAVFLEMPDNKMDQLPMLDVVQKLEQQVRKFQPEIVYTHHAGDLNIDHQIAHTAVLTACRPQPACRVKEIYSFEVPSSTGWSSPTVANAFIPNKYVDITDTLDIKMEALDVYEDEMRTFPHARSIESVAALCRMRGATVGVEAAEAFLVERHLR